MIWQSWLIIKAIADFRVDGNSIDRAGKVTPFRQLIIRLIQGRLGQLSDAEQRVLESFFTRQEDADAWQNNMKGIVGAINQAYFP